jgi:hypothetical protein
MQETRGNTQKYETGPTHAQLVQMTLRRGYTTVSKGAVGFIALLGFEGMGDFAAMDGGDEAVCNRADRLVEVWLCGEDVDRGLRRYGGVIGSELRDGLGVGDGVEWDREPGRGRHSGGGRLIGEVDRRHAVVEEREVGVDGVREVCVRMELQFRVKDGGWIFASLAQVLLS